LRTVVAFPANARFAQQVALAFFEANALKYFATTFTFEETEWGSLLLGRMFVGRTKGVLRTLRRRTIRDVPKTYLRTDPTLEVIRTVAAKLGVGPILVDRIWDLESHLYTMRVARRYVPGADAIYAYEYTALEAFQRAEAEGVARILDFPSLNSRKYEMLQREEKQRFPELVTCNDAYFNRKFEMRQARRDQEMEAADVIIANSSLTRQSHIAGGASPDRIFAVPYGAPPALERLGERAEDHIGRLRLLWAGTFGLRKGAHYLLDAWRMGKLGRVTTLEIFGAITLPSCLVGALPDGVTLHGSVDQATLFSAFDRSDALIFPTLSDGFGMVVTEALARGLPVITTNQAGAADLIVHGKNGLIVEAGDAKAIADVVMWCLDNRSALQAMRYEALETARSWQWSHYRAALRIAVAEGLNRAGYSDQAASLSV
jgi:glycosyltransferase involved in cell wall biosynthesis